MYRAHHTRAKGTVRAPKGSNGLGGVFDWLDLRTLMGVFGYIGEQRVDERQAGCNDSLTWLLQAGICESRDNSPCMPLPPIKQNAVLPEQLVMTADALCSTLSPSPCNTQHHGSVKPVTHPESQTRPDNLPDKLPVLSTYNFGRPGRHPAFCV